MADVAEEKKETVNGEQEQTTADASANGQDEGSKHEAADDTVKSNGKSNEDDTKDAAQADDSKDDDGAPKSPEQKRKEAPLSLSAHERHERKRPRGGYHSKQNIESRFDDQPESNDADEIRRQVEFYFSDSNLPIDSYLLTQTGGHRNRPVELKVIHSFKRMRHFQPYSAVRDAVKASDFLNLNDSDEITRKTPLDEKFTDDPAKNRTIVHSSSMTRSIYAKGFGEESKSTHLDIEAFFDPYGPLKSVRLRRSDDGLFKGSVFVEFQDDELQQRFLDLDPKPKWNDSDLDIMSKQDYVDMKHQGIIDGAVRPRSPFRGPSDNKRRGKDRRYDDRDKRGSRDKYDKDDWKSRRDRDQQDERRDGRGGRGGRGRGGRGGRGDRRGGSDFNDRKGRRSDAGANGAKDEVEQMETKGQTVKTEEEVGKRDGNPVSTGAEQDTGAAATETKKRAFEGEGDEQGDAKKVKEEAVKAEGDS